MYAFPAAKRTLVLVMSIALLVTVAAAQAGEVKGYLGVMLQDLTPSMAKALQMEDESGVMVSEVVDDSPAEKAGLEDGDVILAFNGKTVSDSGDLIKAVRKTSSGDEVEIVVLREGKKKSLDVEVGEHEMKNTFWVSKSDDDEDFTWTLDKMNVFISDDRGYMGVHLDDLNEQMGEYFGVEDGKGALVTEVVADSPAAAAGLKAGDVIVKVGGMDIDSPNALHEAMTDTEPEQQMSVKVMRKGKSRDVSITLGEVPESANTKRYKIVTDGDDDFTIHGAPHMMKYFDRDGDVDIEVIKRKHKDLQKTHEYMELLEADGELQEMRDELEKMKEELKEMKKELKK